jgi:hypothetical protein
MSVWNSGHCIRLRNRRSWLEYRKGTNITFFEEKLRRKKEVEMCCWYDYIIIEK